MALDTNHDGAVSAAGIAAPPNPCAPSIATRTANGPPRNAPKMGSTDRCSKEMVQTLMAFDKNGDGLLTDDEVSPRLARVFVAQRMLQLDADGDGRISQDERAPGQRLFMELSWQPIGIIRGT